MIPDGEYELELSQSLGSHLINLSSGSTTARALNDDEVFSIRYGVKPEPFNTISSIGLVRNAEKPGSFELKVEAEEDEEELTIEGSSTTSNNLEYLLLFNEATQSFQLQNLDHKLRTTAIKTKPTETNATKFVNDANKTQNSTKKDQLKPTTDTTSKKKRIKEPSIFQPKRSKVKRSQSVSSDDEPPSKLKTSPTKQQSLRSSAAASSSSKPSAPSPLSSSYNFTSITERTSSPYSQDKLTGFNNQTGDSSNSRESTPSSGSEAGFKQHPKTTSSKKPPSAISTPTIIQPKPSSDVEEDEFGALADELEEELLSDGNFITIEDRSTTQSITKPSIIKATNTNSRKPLNFRNLAGITSKDEDDLSSSEEE